MRGFTTIALLLGAVLAGAAAGQDAPAPRRVTEVRFEGNRRYTAAYLREQITTKAGEEYDPGALAQDERILRDFFTAVLDVVEEETDDGVVITFHVLDRVIAGDVTFRGLDRVKEADFEPLLATRTGRPIRDHTLKSDIDLIERLHREKGYHFVEVRVERRPTARPDVEHVAFVVLTGRRVKVWEVELEGADSVPRDKLLRLIENSDRHKRRFLGLGRWLNPSYYDETQLEEDRRRLEEYYHQEGWLDARVVLVESRFDEKQQRVQIRFRVVEGERYGLGKFEVVYDDGGEPVEADREFLDPAKLEGLATLASGDPFQVDELLRTRRNINERLWERAYAKSRIADRRYPDPEKKTVDVRFTITAGPKVRAGRIRIYGNRWTRDNVIRRQFRDGALPGDELDLEALEGARNRLAALRFFSRVRFGDGRSQWGLSKSADPDRPDEYDIDLEVEEGETRNISFGAGVSTDGGAFGNVSITWRNFDIKKPPEPFWRILDQEAFRGGGQRFTISASPGTTLSAFVIAFSDPALRDSKWSLSVNTSRRISLFEDYDQIQDAVRVRVGRYLDDQFRWRVGVEWLLRQVILEDPDPAAPVNALDSQGSTAQHGMSLTLSYTHRKEADAFLNGYKTEFGAFASGGILGADVDVFKLSVVQSAGWRVVQRKNSGWHRFLVRASADWGRAFSDTPEIPIFDRYFLGGRSLRGFEWREVGPRSNDRPTGGEFMLTLSTQYTVPLSDPEDGGFGIDLIFFIDQGGLVTEFDDWNGDAWRVSAGFGFGISIGGPTQPPLLIDFGWPLREQDGDRRQIVSVAFERNF